MAESRRLAAIMFTDMVGYTALAQADEGRALEVLERHARLLRPIFPRYGGREVKTIGDAFLVEFDSALNATRCAIEIQNFLHEYNGSSSEDWKIRLRIGLHVGDVVHADGDVLGDAVNVASRIEPLAEPEGICISDQVYAQVRNKLPSQMHRLETPRLKNVRVPLEVYRVVPPWERARSAPRAGHPESRRRLAVLPFANLSPDPKDEFFADGLTEELITELSGLRELRVIARTSVMRFKGSSRGAREIAEELRVGSILEGSVRKAGTRLRITAQLIDAATEEHLWSERFDRELDDVFAVQGEIARNVAERLQLKLARGARRAKTHTPTPAAHTWYLQGRFFWNKRSEAGVREAIRCFERALGLDPHYAQACSGLADCYSILVNRHHVSWAAGGPQAQAAARRAVELDDRLAEAHASLGLALLSDYDYVGAERELRRALELNPGYPSAHQWYYTWFVVHGRSEPAEREISLALEGDPLSGIVLYNAGYFDWISGREEQALRKWDRALELDPGFDFVHAEKVCHYATRTQTEQALAELRICEGLAPPPDDPAGRGIGWMPIGFLYGILGLRDRAQGEIDRMLAAAETSYVPASRIAYVYAGLGEADRFYEWMFRAIGDRSALADFFRTHPLLAPIRADPRYRECLSRFKIPPESE